jgi:myo-inositol-1(or 4)-monophosphatase
MKKPSVNDKKLTRFLHAAFIAAMKARKVHVEYFKKLSHIRNKLDSSLVSEADQKSEKVIRDVFRKKFPDISILGEEEGLEKHSNKSSRWLVDPLDGTTNYIHGYPFFCSSIALEINGEVQVAVVDSAVFKKTYWAVKGFGAFVQSGLRKKKLSVSETKKLGESLIATGFLTYGGPDLKFQIDIFQKFIETTRGVRRSGSAALELCFLAEGLLDGFWEYGLKAWDTGAGSLIVSEAGGRVTNRKDENFHPDDKAIIASNGLIHLEFSDLIGLG